jgi:hypothetical protein
MPIAVTVAPAMAMTVANTRSANHGAGRAADHCANRTCDDSAGCSADCGAGHSSFCTVRRIGRHGQGGKRRETRGDKKFAHRILHSSIAKRTRKSAQSSARQRTVQANKT